MKARDLDDLSPLVLKKLSGILEADVSLTAVNGGQKHAFLLTPDNAGPSPCDVPGTRCSTVGPWFRSISRSELISACS